LPVANRNKLPSTGRSQISELNDGEKYAAAMLIKVWHHVDVKIGSGDVTGNIAQFILNKQINTLIEIGREFLIRRC
jgi:hypothetical protein